MQANFISIISNVIIGVHRIHKVLEVPILNYILSKSVITIIYKNVYDTEYSYLKVFVEPRS